MYSDRHNVNVIQPKFVGRRMWLSDNNPTLPIKRASTYATCSVESVSIIALLLLEIIQYEAASLLVSQRIAINFERIFHLSLHIACCNITKHQGQPYNLHEGKK
jgi:hypothetical protein